MVWNLVQSAELIGLRGRVAGLELARESKPDFSPTAPDIAPALHGFVEIFNSEEPLGDGASPPFAEAAVLWPDTELPLSERPSRKLSSVASVIPRSTLSLSVEGASGISEVVFGADGTASNVALQHDLATSSFALMRNASAILQVGSAGDTQLGGASLVRIYGAQVSLENRNRVTVTAVDGATPLWDRSNLQIYRGDTVTWVWASLQNIAQADSSFASIIAQPGTFYSGEPVLSGTYSLRFDTAGVFYYKSLNTARAQSPSSSFRGRPRRQPTGTALRA